MAANPMASRSAALAGAAQALNKPKQPGGDFRQNLAGATGGTIKGANGGTQQLGSAALRRLGNPAAPTGPNMAGGGLNPAIKQPPSRTPPIMDPMQNPISAAPGMTPYQSGGNEGAVGSGSVDSSIPGDPNARMTSTAPGGQLFQPPPGMQPGSDGNMGGAGSNADLISKLSGSFQPPANVGAALPGFQSPGFGAPHPGGPPTFDTMPGMHLGDPSAALNGNPPEIFRTRPGGGSPGTQPGGTPWMPPGGPNMHGGGLNGDQAPDQHGGGGPLGGLKPPMNTKPLPGAPDQPPTGAGGGVWGRIAGAGGPQQQKPRFPSSGGNMASF